eukprot:COSAG05_NODE_57_length_23291_cov_75.862668_14_plen_209_part_00
MSINRGLDQEMPGGRFMGAGLLAAVKSGEVSTSKLDDSVSRILTQMYKFGLFDHMSQWNGTAHGNDVTSYHNSYLARNLSAASSVLLKNNGERVLPPPAAAAAAAAVFPRPCSFSCPLPIWVSFIVLSMISVIHVSDSSQGSCRSSRGRRLCSSDRMRAPPLSTVAAPAQYRSVSDALHRFSSLAAKPRTPTPIPSHRRLCGFLRFCA